MSQPRANARKKPARATSSKAPKTGGREARGQRFAEDVDAEVLAFTSSVSFDQRLLHHDVRGSLAHVQVLAKAGMLKPREAKALSDGLRAVEADLASGKAKIAPGDEDIHMAVERLLTARLGPLGGKLHTARSRNDQIATDLRLWLRDELDALVGELRALDAAFVELAARHVDTVLPGYTHLQRAQPVRLAHHLLAYHEMLSRDRGRFLDARGRLNRSPLGSAALAGTTFPLDRELSAKLLGFDGPTANSLDATSDRDFVVEFLAAAALLQAHLSRFAEELVLWSSAEFAFAELPDSHSTGSSIMPQKKNPDVAELIRGRTGRVNGALVAILTVLKGLPLAYNRDLQEDKQPLFEAVDVVRGSVRVLTSLVPRLVIRTETMERAAEDPALMMTDVADALAREGLPFREAHAAVGALVRTTLALARDPRTLDAKELKAIHPRLRLDHVKGLEPGGSTDQRRVIGGTAREAIVRALARARKDLAR
ncbi:MAG: argininosuccinate lyase [Deltaproteobacteria bacterium]|nr:argininosuccinate lyase [Deltaproteobacteria bacterium]